MPAKPFPMRVPRYYPVNYEMQREQVYVGKPQAITRQEVFDDAIGQGADYENAFRKASDAPAARNVMCPCVPCELCRHTGYLFFDVGLRFEQAFDRMWKRIQEARCPLK